MSLSNYTHLTNLNPDIDFDEFLGLNYLTSAVYNFIQALNSMNKLFRFFKAQEYAMQDFFKEIYGYFNNDEWINSEYMGLNIVMGGNTFKEIMEQFEVSL